MVSLSERDAVVSQALEDDELAPYAEFVFGHLDVNELIKSRSDPHLVLLRSIATKDRESFEQQMNEIDSRVIKNDCDWIENDCLVFLLILGCELFAVKSESMDRVLAGRERNRNPVAISTNSVLRALSRREFRMEGRYCFIKVVFLGLIGRFEINRDDLTQCYDAVSHPGLLVELHASPFLQLLVVRAFDLLICKFSPTAIDSLADVVNAVHRLSPQMTLSTWWRLVRALPLKLLLAMAIPVWSTGAMFGAYAYHAMKTPLDPKPQPPVAAVKQL